MADPSRGVLLCRCDAVLAACALRCCCVHTAFGPCIAFADFLGVKQRAWSADQGISAVRGGLVVRRRPSESAVMQGDCHSLWHSVVDLRMWREWWGRRVQLLLCQSAVVIADGGAVQEASVSNVR